MQAGSIRSVSKSLRMTVSQLHNLAPRERGGVKGGRKQQNRGYQGGGQESSWRGTGLSIVRVKAWAICPLFTDFGARGKNIHTQLTLSWLPLGEATPHCLGAQAPRYDTFERLKEQVTLDAKCLCAEADSVFEALGSF